MNCIHKKMTEQTPLNLKPTASSSRVGPRPVPTASLLKPWEFDYSPSPDGKDLNLLIMFHGLGDTKGPFFKLAKSFNLPGTAVLSLQAPTPIPFLETQEHYSWYNTFDPMFNPLPNPDPTPAIPHLRRLLQALVSPEVGWDLTDIHLFGWGQGGTMALELAYNLGREGLTIRAETRERLGSVISVCANLISFPATPQEIETPVLLFSRQTPSSAIAAKHKRLSEKAFKKVEVVYGDPRGGEAMPRDRKEFEGIMRFWASVLNKDDGWKGSGDVYEVVR